MLVGGRVIGPKALNGEGEGQKCFNCGKFGHFKNKCRKLSQPKSQVKPKSTGEHQVSGLNTAWDDAIDLQTFAYSVMPQTNEHATRLCVGRVTISNVMIDSGASCNLMSKATWENVKQSQVRATFRKESIRLFAYGSEKPLSIHEIVTTDVVSIDTNAKCTADFVVIQRDAITLLGKHSAISVGLLRVGPQVSHVDHYPESRDLIMSRYKDLFTGVGLLKYYSVHLHIDKNIKPVAQPMRRTPFRLREKVDKKLDELLAYGIIEPL